MTQANFDKSIDRVLGNEGGYVNNPHDPGGETNWGVTKNTAMANGYTGAMRTMTREQAKAIYKTAFWNKIKADTLDDAVAYQIFDAAVNHGIGNAVRMMQRAIDVADDGVVGSVTLEALQAAKVNDFVVLINVERIRFYTKLSTFSTFGKGWMNRIATNLTYGVGDA